MSKIELVYKGALERLQKEVLTTGEAMSYLGVSRKTLDRLREGNVIRCVKVRRCARYHLIDLVEYSLSGSQVSATIE